MILTIYQVLSVVSERSGKKSCSTGFWGLGECENGIVVVVPICGWSLARGHILGVRASTEVGYVGLQI